MGVLDRLMLKDDQWERMSRHIIGDERTRGSSGRDNRIFVEAVLWSARTSSPWRDLSDVFGPWNSAFRLVSRWSIKGIWLAQLVETCHAQSAGKHLFLAHRPTNAQVGPIRNGRAVQNRAGSSL